MIITERIKDFFQERRYRRQRAKRGWSVKDTWNIDYWFLNILPQMLEYLKEHHIGFPVDIQREYVNSHREELNMTYEEYCVWPSDKNSDGYKLRERTDEACNRLWNEILDRMIFLLKEANEETCSVKNLYEEESRENHSEFIGKYGADEYRDRCKTEAINLFNKWFWNLWD